ncbi:MAG: HAMP domain-containing histidine kinase [Candidatus Marinimicrobia bacterium]|nr:HAMP domain-containing histidine kinase [Candidatus Neomarinimicrobiota bacterium]
MKDNSVTPDFQVQVLVVDDMADIRTMLTDFLTWNGYSVIASADGASARLQLAEHKPHILLADLSLPDIQGSELIDLAKKENSMTTGIIMSGHHLSDLEPETVAAIDDYIAKPFTLKEVEKVIGKWGNYHKALAECDQLKQALNNEQQKIDFFSQAGHQLKSPVAVIKEFVHLFSEGYGGKISAKQEQYLEAINHNLNQLIHLIDNIESLTRVSSAKWPIRLDVEEPAELIRQTSASWRPILEGQKLAFTEEIPDGLPKVRVDEAAVEQVLYNLIDNARKYCSPGGTIYLRCHAEANNRVCIELENPGACIPAEYHEAIFKPFTRLPEHDAAPGLGLGLTIARSLVESMGGELTVSDQCTTGALFNLYLPVAE